MNNPPPENAPEPRTEPELPAWARRQNVKSPMSDERMAAFIGDKWASVYRRKFEPYMLDPTFVPTWNWSAALATPYWFLYRKLYLPFIIFIFAPNIAARLMLGPDAPPAVTTMAQPDLQQSMLVSLSFLVSTMIAAGGTANWLLFRRARAATQLVAMQQLPEDEARELLGKLGGVHRGPTILIVVLAATVLAAQVFASQG